MRHQFAKGNKLGRGRPKGALNIRTKAVTEILAKMPNDDGGFGFDPVRELVELYHRTANTNEVTHLAVKCLEILMPYCYSKVSVDTLFTPEDLEILYKIKELKERPTHEIIEITKNELKKVE